MRDLHNHSITILCCSLLTLTMMGSASAQSLLSPPIHGFTATVVTPETVDKFYTGLNAGLDKLGDGLDQINGKKRPTIRGGKAALEGLEPGTPVIVRYTVKGIDASSDPTGPADAVSPNRGTIAGIDRSANRITVAFATGGTDTFRAAHESNARSSRVIVYRTNETGGNVVRYFKLTSR